MTMASALVNDLVTVNKRTLSFKASAAQVENHPSDKIDVRNVCDSDLAFKVKTTNQSRYIVRPNVGVIAKDSTVTILVGVQPAETLTPDFSKDKFMLLVAAEPQAAQLGLPDTYWSGREKDVDVGRIKFKVSSVQTVSDEKEEDDEQSQPYHTTVDNTIDQVMPVAPVVSPSPRQRDLPPSVIQPASTQVTTAPGDVITSPVRETRPVSSESPVLSPISHDGIPRRISGMSDIPESVDTGLPDADELLQEGNYEKALQRVRDLQLCLDEKNLELTRLRTELAETRAESEKVLKEAPQTPLSANKVLADPFGGVSVVGIGVMLLLFLILVNIIVRIS